MAKRKNDYWKRRFEELEKALHEKGVSYYRLLEKDFQKAARDTINDINSLLATEGMVSLSEAKKMLTDEQLDDFRESLEDYIEFGKENGLDQRWMSELEKLTLRNRISKLEAMKAHIKYRADMLYYNELNGATKLVGDTYEESYNKAAFILSVGLGLLVGFSPLKHERINDVISTPWTADSINLSERIWGKHRVTLIHDLQKGLTQSIIRGESPKKLIDFISKKYNVSKAQAGRLVLTEISRVTSEAQMDMFKQSGVKYYQIVATLDNRTSEICRYMDGKVFKTSEYEIGVTANPFHPNCRTITAPYFKDMNVTERAARDKDGKTVYVEGDMTYEQWHNKYVKDKK